MKRAALALLCCLCAATADAQTTGDRPAARPEIIVVTAEGRAQARDDVPAAIAVIDGEDLAALKALRVGTALAGAPGAFAAGLNGPREVVQIRQPLAFDNRTLFLEDGVPLQSPVFFDQSALGYSQALASPGGIEVLRGPGTALYGSDALSGVVHVRTRAPRAEPTIGARARYGSFALFDFQAEAGGAVSERHALRTTGAVSGEDGYRDETAFHRVNGMLRHRYRGDGIEVDSGLYTSRFETESATAIPFDAFEAGSRAAGLDPAVDEEEAIEQGRYWRVQSRLRAEIGDAWEIEATPYWRRQEIDATATFQPATTPRSFNDVATIGLLPRARWRGARAKAMAGVDLEFTELDVLTVQSRPDTVVFGELFRQGVQFDYTVDFRAISPYAQVEQRLGPVQLRAGLRYDALRYDFDNALSEVPGDARLQLADRIDRFDALSPKAGILWDISAAHSLFLRYARGFRIPRASELYELSADQTGFTLDPERLDSVEIGWRGGWQSVSAELIGYWQISRNGVLTDVQTAAGNISVNAGKRRFAGIEATLSAVLGYGFDVRAVFAWQDFRFRRRSAGGGDPFDGNQLAEAPRTLGTLDLGWTPPAIRSLRLNGRLRHIGRWPLNDANTLFTEREYILSLWAEWRPRDWLTAEIKVENATDAIYAVFADAPAFAPQGRARPGPGRAISGGVRIAF